jgi:hypothetical protein
MPVASGMGSPNLTRTKALSPGEMGQGTPQWSRWPSRCLGFTTVGRKSQSLIGVR